MGLLPVSAGCWLGVCVLKFGLFVLCLLVCVYGLYVVSGLLDLGVHNAGFVLVNVFNFILFLFFVFLVLFVVAYFREVLGRGSD